VGVTCATTFQELLTCLLLIGITAVTTPQLSTANRFAGPKLLNLENVPRGIAPNFD
jgi:hypothetical protein